MREYMWGMRRPVSWRRPLIVIGAVTVATAASIVGIASAAPGGSADVTFVPLSPVKKILSTTIGAHKTNSPVVIGASTTVPTDATSVQLLLTIKSAAAGTLSVFPAGNPASSSQDVLSFPGANALVAPTTNQNIGASNKITLVNNGSATATVTVTITGYSTQLTAAGIAGTGGSAGEVLTNTGSGASWQQLLATGISPAGGSSGDVLTNTGTGTSWQKLLAGSISSTGGTAGQVLTNTGTGTAWRDAGGAGYSTSLLLHGIPGRPTETAAGSINLPAGSYLLNYAATVWNTTTGPALGVDCRFLTATGTLGGDIIIDVSTGDTFAPIAGTAVAHWNGGVVQLVCSKNTNFPGTVWIERGTFTAVQLSSSTP